MAFSVSPSVIVREIDASAVIPATATPPGAIAGVFRWGPVNEPILITSEDRLVERFGKPTDLNSETFFVAADFLAYSNSLYVVRVEDGANTASSTHFEAKYPGEIANSIEVSYVTRDDFEEEIADIGDLTGTIIFNSETITIQSTVDFFSEFEENDIMRIGNDSVGYQNLYVDTFTDNSTANTGIYDYVVTFKNRYTLSQLDLANLKIERKWGYSDLFGKAPDAGNMHIIIKDVDGGITGTPDTVVETYENLSVVSTAKLSDGTTNYYVNVLENSSAWVKASSTIIDTSIAVTEYERLVGGSDGLGETSNDLFGELAQGYDKFADPKELDIAFVLQGKGNTTLDASGLPTHANLANYIISNVVDNRKDCVVFLSPAREAVVDPANANTKMNRAIAYRNKIQSSSYWFMDSGYKYRYDKYNDVYRWVPLNGDMAGLASRIEPWESPAGYRKGLIKNVVKLAFNPNKAQRDLLYGSDINSVIAQTGQGILLFGDKTGLGRASAFDRINVRRLFITVEKAIATAAESFLFEFNDEFTQNQFKNLVEPYLRDIQGRRGIIDFRVVSDSTVNTPDVIDQNKFRANIFIKPARSINVIELTFVATRTGTEFDEIVGQIT